MALSAKLSWKLRLEKLRERCAMDSAHSDNFEKRVLYSEVELLKMELEELSDLNGGGGCGSGRSPAGAAGSSPRQAPALDVDKCLEELQSLGEKLKLGWVRRRRQWWDKMDEIARLIGVWVCLVVFAVVFSPLGILLRPVDYVLVTLRLLPPWLQASLLLKRFMGYVILWTAGVVLVTEGGEIEGPGGESFFMANNCVLCCFSHASTLDAFIIAAVIPVRSYILSKTDLFLIPFFSWLLAAFGGIPIDRGNRSQAVQSLRLAAESAAEGDCVAVAPEGTRSTTGQLLAFKKGPFHLWEQLQSPVVPVVIFGAYDLFPPGAAMTLSGRVYVRFLPPVEPPVELIVAPSAAALDQASAPVVAGGATQREQMSRAVRRRMLEALLHSPRDAGSELTWRERALTSGVLLGVLAFARLLSALLYELVVVHLRLSALQAAGGGLALSLVVTAAVYVGSVCVPPARSRWLQLMGLGGGGSGAAAAVLSNGGDPSALAAAPASSGSPPRQGGWLPEGLRGLFSGRWATRSRRGYSRLPGMVALPGASVELIGVHPLGPGASGARSYDSLGSSSGGGGAEA